MDISKLLNQYRELKAVTPVPAELVDQMEATLGPLSADLRGFYERSNGLLGGNFRILPVFDPHRPRQTWDSIERANDPTTSKFVSDPDFLRAFLIFAQIEGGFVGLSRKDGSIWFSDQDTFRQTDLDVAGLIEALAKEGL
jgi:hypothetical protein